MAFNRVLDADIDGRNPRTANRHLPAGHLSARFAWGFIAIWTIAFLGASAMLNSLPAIALLPLALIWLGLGDPSIVFVLVHSVMWPVALNTHSGFKAVSPTLRMVGRNYGLGGPRYVVTPLCVMDFEDGTKRMRLKSLHPGVSVDDVKKNTGFELVIPANVPTTEPPTDEQLHVLRTRIDGQGVLRK